MPLADSGSALFAGSAREFITMAPASSLTAHLKARFGRFYGTPGESEVNSWRRSLTARLTLRVLLRRLSPLLAQTPPDQPADYQQRYENHNPTFH